MKYVSLTCPNCGAAARVDAEKGSGFCEYCGSPLTLDDEQQKVTISIDNAEDAGYKFEKGRQRAKAEAQRSTIEYHEVPKKKRKTWLWVLGWIFIFPIPATILITRNKKLNVVIKGILIAVCWLVYILIGSSGSNESKNDPPSTVSPSPSINSSTSEESIPTPTETASDSFGISDFDALQILFTQLSSSTTEDDLKQMIADFGDLPYGSRDWNGTPKKIVYKIAFDEEVTPQRYAKEGDNIEVSFSKEDGSFMYAAYEYHSKLTTALLYNYGTYWDLRLRSPGQYSGYYYYRAGDLSKDGLLIEYENGNSVHTSYHPCETAEEAVIGAVSFKK